MRTQVFIVLVAVLAFASANDFSSLKYQEQSAKEKMDQLWQAITADTTPYGWYSALSLLQIFFEKMKPTFDTYSDNMPEGRKKLIHSVGSVAKAEFIAEKGSQYTGMFKGAKNVLLRISTAKEPNPKSGPSDNFTPGFGIKLLRDNMPSANLVAMYSVDGQDSWNLFKNDWSHHIPNSCAFALKLLSKKFSEATPYIGRMGLKTWAQYDQKGNEVAKDDLKIPFRIVFRPTSEVKSLFPDTYQTDFNTQLASIDVGTGLYDVYAIPAPHAEAVRIGTIKTTSKFTTSKFGDKDLFFQHNYLEDDIGVHPEWEKYWAIDPPIQA